MILNGGKSLNGGKRDTRNNSLFRALAGVTLASCFGCSLADLRTAGGQIPLLIQTVQQGLIQAVALNPKKARPEGVFPRKLDHGGYLCPASILRLPHKYCFRPSSTAK